MSTGIATLKSSIIVRHFLKITDTLNNEKRYVRERSNLYHIKNVLLLSDMHLNENCWGERNESSKQFIVMTRMKYIFMFMEIITHL